MPTNSLLKAIGMYKQAQGGHDPDDPRFSDAIARNNQWVNPIRPTSLSEANERIEWNKAQQFKPGQSNISSYEPSTPYRSYTADNIRDYGNNAIPLQIPLEVGGKAVDTVVGGLGAYYGHVGGFLVDAANRQYNPYGGLGGYTSNSPKAPPSPYMTELAKNLHAGGSAAWRDVVPEGSYIPTVFNPSSYGHLNPARFTPEGKLIGGVDPYATTNFRQWIDRTSPSGNILGVNINRAANTALNVASDTVAYGPLGATAGAAMSPAGYFGGGAELADVGLNIYLSRGEQDARNAARNAERDQWHQDNTSFDAVFGDLSPQEQRGYANAQVLEAQSNIEARLQHSDNTPENQSNIALIVAENDAKILKLGGFLFSDEAGFNALPENVKRVLSEANSRQRQREQQQAQQQLTEKGGSDNTLPDTTPQMWKQSAGGYRKFLAENIPGWLKKLTGGVDDAAKNTRFPEGAFTSGHWRSLDAEDLQGILDGTPFRYKAERAELARMIAQRKLDDVYGSSRVPYAKLAPPQMTARTVPGGGSGKSFDFLKTPDVNPYRAPSYIDPRPTPSLPKPLPPEWNPHIPNPLRDAIGSPTVLDAETYWKAEAWEMVHGREALYDVAKRPVSARSAWRPPRRNAPTVSVDFGDGNVHRVRVNGDFKPRIEHEARWKERVSQPHPDSAAGLKLDPFVGRPDQLLAQPWPDHGYIRELREQVAEQARRSTLGSSGRDLPWKYIAAVPAAAVVADQYRRRIEGWEPGPFDNRKNPAPPEAGLSLEPSQEPPQKRTARSITDPNNSQSFAGSSDNYDGYDENYRQSEKQYFDADHPGMSTPPGTGSSRAFSEEQSAQHDYENVMEQARAAHERLRASTAKLEKGSADNTLPNTTPTTVPNPSVAPAVSLPISVKPPTNKIPNKYGPLAPLFDILPPPVKNWYDNLEPRYQGMINQGFSQLIQNMQGNPALPASNLVPTAFAGAQNAKPEFEPTVASAARYAGNIYR